MKRSFVLAQTYGGILAKQRPKRWLLANHNLPAALSHRGSYLELWSGIYIHYTETEVIICPALAAVIREGLVNLAVNGHFSHINGRIPAWIREEEKLITGPLSSHGDFSTEFRLCVECQRDSMLRGISLRMQSEKQQEPFHSQHQRAKYSSGLLSRLYRFSFFILYSCGVSFVMLFPQVLLIPLSDPFILIHPIL